MFTWITLLLPLLTRAGDGIHSLLHVGFDGGERKSPRFCQVSTNCCVEKGAFSCWWLTLKNIQATVLNKTTRRNHLNPQRSRLAQFKKKKLYCPIGISHLGHSGCFSRENHLQQSCATQPMVQAGCFSLSIIHQTLPWTTGSSTCAQVLMHVTEHGSVRTLEESALKASSGREKSLAALGNRTCINGVPVWRSIDWATSSHISEATHREKILAMEWFEKGC